MQICMQGHSDVKVYCTCAILTSSQSESHFEVLGCCTMSRYQNVGWRPDVVLSHLAVSVGHGRLIIVSRHTLMHQP